MQEPVASSTHVPERERIYEALRQFVLAGAIASFTTNYNSKAESDQLLVTATLNPLSKQNRDELRFQLARALEAAGVTGPAVAVAASIDDGHQSAPAP
jgi:hypothetical protein